MIWKITFLLTCFSVSIIAGAHFPGESSRSNESPQEYLEELYNEDTIRLLNIMPTLDITDFIDDNDVRLLSIECEVDEDCLNEKKTSIEKYHQKMQAIQCVNGLYALNVLNKLKSIMADMKDNDRYLPIVLFRKPINEFKFYLTSMLTLLKLAKWDAYPWQIEIFTFLSGLSASDVNIETYAEHYEDHYGSMQAKVLAFVNRCVEDNYLLSLNESGHTELVFPFIRSMYIDNEVLKLLKSPSLFYTVPNIMLQYLYLHDDFIFNWSMFKIELDTNNVKEQMRTELGLNYPQDKIEKWRLDPFGGNKYHIIISKYIHLRAEFVAWFHLYAYHTILDRLLNVTAQDSDIKELLIGIWKTIVPEIKCVLRAVRFDENIYWSAINIMMVDLKTISKEELAAREQYTRNYFCKSVEDLGLASASDMNQQLEKIEIPNDFISIHRSIQDNTKKTAQFCHEIERVSSPFNERFIRTLLGAEGNETFVMR